MNDYYFKEDGKTIKEELVDSQARDIAKKLTGRNKLNSSQLRKFFNEVKHYHNLLKVYDSEEKFEEFLPLIKMIKAKVAYSSRDKIPVEFVEFLSKNIDLIKNRKDFNAFVLHFESVVGFFYSMEKTRY